MNRGSSDALAGRRRPATDMPPGLSPAEEGSSPAGAAARAGRPGWALPLRLDPTGQFPSVRPETVAETARLILEVAPGERRLLPAFGCRLHLLPRIENAAERHVAAALAEEALGLWAPELKVDRVDVVSVEGRTLVLALRSGEEWHRLRISHRGPPQAGGRASRHVAAGEDGRWEPTGEERMP